MNKLKNWYETLQPEVQVKLVKSIVFPLLFLLLIIPSIIWFSLPNNYNSKNDWLQDFAWIFPLTIIVSGVVTTASYMVYNYIKDTKK